MVLSEPKGDRSSEHDVFHVPQFLIQGQLVRRSERAYGRMITKPTAQSLRRRRF